MRTEPSRSRPVAVFAGHTFGDFEGATALVWRGVKRVASEAFGGFPSLGAQFQDMRHAFTDVSSERLVGAAVLVLKDPGRILILQDAAFRDWFNVSVAARRGARSRANVFDGPLFLPDQHGGG